MKCVIWGTGKTYFNINISTRDRFYFWTVLIEMRKWPETTWNNLQRARNDLEQPATTKKRPGMTYNEQETIWNNPQRVKHNLQWPEHTCNKQRKGAKRPTTSIFSDYVAIWGKRFSSLTDFPPKIWLQLFEHCFTENHGENRPSSIYHHASSVSYHLYFLRGLRFIFFCHGFVTAGKKRGYYFGLSPPLPPASQIVWSLTRFSQVDPGTILHFFIVKTSIRVNNGARFLDLHLRLSSKPSFIFVEHPIIKLDVTELLDPPQVFTCWES